MERQVYRYRVGKAVPFEEAEQTLALALLAVECLVGEAEARLDASLLVDQEKRTCVIDASTEVGRKVARVFTGLLAKQFGDDAFEVRRRAGVR